jgi:ribose transport system substrate-binding protein
MVTAGVNGIVCVYIDMDAIMQSVRLCNERDIPFVYSDRPVINTDEIKTDWGIATDNYQLTYNGWKWTAEYAKKNGMVLNVLELQGSLTDDNVLKRADALRDVQKEYPEIIKIVQTVPTEWNLEKCLAGVTNAMSAHPEINCVFLMSDFLIPPVVQALQAADRYKLIGDPEHVFMMGYSGSGEAVRLMQEKYMDMCFGMDVIKTGYESVKACYALATGDKTTYTTPVDDPGFIMTQENLAETSKIAYGTNVK